MSHLSFMWIWVNPIISKSQILLFKPAEFDYFARMFALLYQYLIEQGEVFLQGIGRMQMIPQPAAYDVANQQLLAPRHAIQVQTDAVASSMQTQTAFISRNLNIPEEEAFELYQTYCRDLQKDISKKRTISWDGLGTLEKLQDGNYTFTNAPALELYRQPVTAERVIRKGVSHTMMVGTTETTSDAMRELLEDQAVFIKKSRWWIAAAIISIVAIGLIFLRRMEYL